VFPLAVIFISSEHHPGLIILSFFVSAFVLFTHRKNLIRLFNGTENKFNFRGGKLKNE
jgi:glycerol-3-phosphate acyltransferase PlsY